MYALPTLRRKAHKIGYHIDKGFIHFQGNVYHNQDGERFTGYMVLNLQNGFYEWDGFDSNFDHLWSLEDVELFLKGKYDSLGLSW